MDAVSPIVRHVEDAELAEIDLGRIAELHLTRTFADAVGTAHDVDEEREVFGVSRERSRGAIARGVILRGRILTAIRDEAARGLMPEDPVEEGGHADGAADVGSETKGAAACADDRALSR